MALNSGYGNIGTQVARQGTSPTGLSQRNGTEMAAKTIVYIADSDRGSDIKGDLRHYPQEAKVGTVGGLGTNPSYISDMCNSVLAQAGKIDMVIFDQQSMSGALGGDKQALQAIMDALRTGIAKVAEVYVYDPDGIINAKGRAAMENVGVNVVRDLSQIGGIFYRVYGDFSVEPVDQERTHHKDPEMILPAMADGEGDVARRDGLDLVSERDYFSDASRVSTTDVFNQFMDRDEGIDQDGRDYFDDDEEDEKNLDSLWDDAERAERKAATLDDFYEQNQMSYMQDEHDDDYYETERRKEAVYDRNEVEDDLKPIAWLAANPEVGWTYEEISDALSKPGTSLFKSRAQREKLGEVSNASLFHSQYIPQQQEIRGGIYQAPNECKIISCYSLAGGSGKTTVAGMIGVQLNWCFNTAVMQKRSTAWVARILVLSLNEFDDLSVKGIGYDNPMGNTTDRKNVAELLRRIEECGGEPEWDDISDCFAANTENYVYYVPSLTLKERLELNIDISAEDYKNIITVCSKFFGFIVLDMPDIMYDHKDGLVEFALNNAHIVTYIMEPNTKSTTLLFQLLQGLRDKDGNLMIDPDKWMVIVNKYAKADSPYIGYVDNPENFGQVTLDSIRGAVHKYFFDIQAIPLTSRRDQGNIIFGRDPNVKRAARDIVDSILAQIDSNDEKTKVIRDTNRRLR